MNGVCLESMEQVVCPIVLDRASPRWDNGTELLLGMFVE